MLLFMLCHFALHGLSRCCSISAGAQPDKQYPVSVCWLLRTLMVTVGFGMPQQTVRNNSSPPLVSTLAVLLLATCQQIECCRGAPLSEQLQSQKLC